MKTVGIIGGLGPETTAEFYLEISFGCAAVAHANRPAILIWSVPLKFAIEEEVIILGKGEQKCLPYLLEGAKKLEAAGADFLVMPCNTLHIFIKDIRTAVKIPVLSILEETSAFLAEKKIKRVGLLATSTTLRKKLYEIALKNAGITPAMPDAFDQAKMGKMISNLISNRHSNRDREQLIAIINKFEERDVKTVILACTDLQLLIPSHPKLQIFDTMKILADATVREILN